MKLYYKTNLLIFLLPPSLTISLCFRTTFCFLLLSLILAKSLFSASVETYGRLKTTSNSSAQIAFGFCEEMKGDERRCNGHPSTLKWVGEGVDGCVGGCSAYTRLGLSSTVLCCVFFSIYSIVKPSSRTYI